MYPFSNHEKHSIHQYILDQITEAFENPPNLASTIHGQRKIHQGCYGCRTSLFPSTKCGGAIPLESRVELAHAVCLEKDPLVKCFRTQAIKIPLSETTFCYPDFLIQTTNNNYEIHEVKPSISSLSMEDIERFLQISELLKHTGIIFRIIDQKDLPTNQYLQQLLHWHQRGHRRSWSQVEISLAIEILEHQKFCRSEQVYAALNHEGIEPLIGDYLLFHEVISLISPKKYYLGEDA